MEKTGVVKASDGCNITVAVVRDSACGENCAACGLCGNLREMTVEVKNTEGFREGDTVRLVSDDKAVFGRSILGYASLTAMLIGGAAAGNALGGDVCAFIGAVLGVAVGVGVVRICARHCGDLEIRAERIEKL